MNGSAKRFFVVGGTLEPNAPSYVLRSADTTLLRSLQEGEFCYVLDARQMGKSSLMIRTKAALQAQDYRAVILDLATIGQNVSEEQWYYGLLILVADQLDLVQELREFWLQNKEISPLQRWLSALRQVILPQSEQPLVIFIDEIDAVRSLPFSADGLFIGIRACYNHRSHDPDFHRLTFCLLGVATPADLISDVRVTPFNIGRRIELSDFTEEEAAPLAEGLSRTGRDGEKLLRRVFYWTGGQPYLTQRLCQAITEDPTVTGSVGVDHLCEELFLSSRARHSDDNLALVRNRLLKSEIDPVRLLDLYAQVRLRGKRVRDDPASPLVSILRLSGIVQAVAGCLWVRNRIYHRVFDRAFVQDNMPGAEWRRQQAAFRRGVLRTSGLSAAVIAVMGGLVWNAASEAHLAAQRAQQERHLSYVADISLAQRAVDDLEIADATGLLKPHYSEGLRAYEWGYLWRQCHLYLLSFKASPGRVYSLSVSPDGRRLATGGDDHTIKLWDTATGQEVRRFLGHTASVMSVAFSPDGKWLATGGDDCSVLLWDSATGQKVRTFQGHTKTVASVAFSSNGKWLATASWDGTARVWDTFTGQSKCILHLQTRVFSVAFSPDGKTLVTGGDDHAIKLWDTATGQEVRRFLGHTASVMSVAFSPDGKWLATGSYDGTARIWNIATGQEIRTLAKHTQPVRSVAFSKDGKTLATAGSDGTVKTWNVEMGLELHTFATAIHVPTCVAFCPDGKRLAVAGFGGMVKLFDNAVDRDELTLKGFQTSVPTVFNFSPDGTRLLSIKKDNTMQLWDTMTGQECPLFRGNKQTVAAQAISAAGTLSAVYSGYDSIKIYKTATGQDAGDIKVRYHDIHCLAFSPDGVWLAAGRRNGSVMLWDLTIGREVRTLKGHSVINSVVFSSDGKRLAAGSWDGTAQVWDTEDEPKVWKTVRHKSIVESLAFSPDGRSLATGGQDGKIKLWDVETGRELLNMVGHEDICAAAFSRDGDTLMTVSREDGVIQRWRAASRAEIDAQMRAEP